MDSPSEGYAFYVVVETLFTIVKYEGRHQVRVGISLRTGPVGGTLDVGKFTGVEATRARLLNTTVIVVW